MLKDIKNKIKKYGFISIELVILASVMLTAGGYGISKLGNNASGSTRNETEAFNKLFEKELTEEEKKFLEFKNNITDNKVKTIYKDGEKAVSKDANSTININGVDCYVLEFNEDKTQAKLITKNIYNVRFDDGGHTSAEVEGHISTGNGYTDKTYDYKYSTLRTWMNDFYVNKLGTDSRILSTTVTYYTNDNYSDNLNIYATGTITNQYVFALDGKEAEHYASKFRWNSSNKQINDDDSLSSNISYFFWTTAGFRRSNGGPSAWHVNYVGGFDYHYVDRSDVGARPAFWISLD